MFMTVATEKESLFLSDRQRFALLDWVGEQPHNGHTLRAFLATVALAALRPTEALALRVRDLDLAEEGFDALRARIPKRTARDKESDVTGDVRRALAPPDLVAILKTEIAHRELKPEAAMFVLDDGQPLTEAVYREVWKRARAAVLETHEIATPLGRNVTALRDACIAAWPRDGDQNAQHILAVAECADISCSPARRTLLALPPEAEAV
jgi:integrase